MAQTMLRSGTTMRTLLAVILLLGCGSDDDRGSCSYSHCDDFVVEASKVIKNPAVKLKREYWVTFQNGDRVAMFPRPDNATEATSECGKDTTMAGLLARNGICPPADVAKVNAMSREDALAVSTFLHDRLRFVARGNSVLPFPYTDDTIGVCDANPTARTGALKAVCDRAYQRRSSDNRAELAVQLTEAEAAAFAPLLNQLYGVPS